MKNIRLFYRKGGEAKYISHLDTTRFMTRVIRRSKIPVWHTEGFNPHPYITFALPLSLGYDSDYEVMDIRLTDDEFDISSLCVNLNSYCPEFIRFFDATEPQKKVAALSFAEFQIFIEDISKISLETFFKQDCINVSKKTKKGDIKHIDVAPKIRSFDISECDGGVLLKITLPAGSSENINPELILKAFFEKIGTDSYYQITRTALLDINMHLFR